ncbi:MAG: alpha-L-rhamnosidase N-terminal domain-containing protein [Bacteroidales bacterium]
MVAFVPHWLFELEIEYADGSKKMVVSDESWTCEEGPIRLSSIRLGETYDANWKPEGWDQPGFDDQQWHDVRVVRGPRGELKAQNRPRVKIMDKLEPEKIKRIGEESFLDIVDTQKPNGSLAPIVPTSGWGYDWGILPAWNHALFEIP